MGDLFLYKKAGGSNFKGRGREAGGWGDRKNGVRTVLMLTD